MKNVRNYLKRKKRVRFSISGNSSRSHRLTVFKSLRYIYAQIVNDENGKVVSSVSSKNLEGALLTKNVLSAQAVGRLIAKEVLKKGVTEVVFDRNGYKYHGRVKALADAAREEGLVF